MPQVQYVDQVGKQRITKTMPTPKKITQMPAWYKQARKAIPEIPDVYSKTSTGMWYIINESANTDYITFEVRHRDGYKRHIVIFRNLNKGLGGMS